MLVLIYRPRKDGRLRSWLHTEINVWHQELNLTQFIEN